MLSILGALVGFATSTFPNVMKFFQDKSDKKHELTMLQETARIEKDRAVQVATIQAQSASQLAQIDADKASRTADIQRDIKELDAIIESNKGLSERDKPHGLGWIDSLRGSVRPLVTYWWMLLYSIVKAMMLIHALEVDGLDLIERVRLVWTEEDMGLFAAIITFWFGHRMCQKQGNH